MEISIIIPAYNAAATLGKLLDSIYKTTTELVSSGKLKFEVIVVDDGSTDTSAEIAARYHVRLIKQANSGPALARNKGAEKARYGHLLFLDADVVLLSDTVKEVIMSFDDKSIDAVNGRYYKKSANKGFFQTYKTLMDYYLFKDPIRCYEKFDSRVAAIKKDVFTKAGGFNTAIKGATYENEEFGYRLSSNYVNVFNPKIQVMHHFPDFKKLVKSHYRRSFDWLQLFLQRRKFDSTLTTRQLGIATAIAPLIALFLVLGIIDGLFFYVSSFFLAAYIALYFGFYMFVLREKGLLISFLAFLTTYFFSLVVCTAGFFSLIDYMTKRSVLKV